MKTLKKLTLVILIILACLLTFSACNTASQNYTGFYLQFITKTVYPVGESVNILIKERNGSPKGYNVYQKIDENPYEFWKTTTASSPIVVQFDQTGIYYVKVVAVIDGVEQSHFNEVYFTVKDASELELQQFYLKDNIVDLYYNVNNRSDSYNINNDLDIVYVPDYAIQKNLTYSLVNNDNILVNNGIVKAVGYSSLQEPYVLPFNCSAQGKEHIKANLYFRINNSANKTALTKIFAGYVNQNYYNGDWISFQFMEYAGMNAAEDYIVARRIGDEYVDLSSQGIDAEVEKKVEHGVTFHKVKVVEPAGGYVNLRIYAKINGAKSNVYTDVNIRVSEPMITAANITLKETERVLLLDQSYKIESNISPQNAFDKSVSYEILGGGSSYISVNENGVITPKKATDEPVTIKVVSNSNTSVYAEFQVTVLNYTEEYFNITNNAPLVQNIGNTQNITFSAETSVESVTWYLNGNPVGASSQFTMQLNAPLVAGDSVITAKLGIDEGCNVYINKTVTLISAFSFVNLHSNYEVDATVDFEYDTSLTDISVRWDIYTEDGTAHALNVGASYTFAQADKYQIVARFSKNGQPLEDKYSNIISIVDGLSHELFNIHTNGYFDGANYAPLIKWYGIPFGTEITVQIIRGTQTEVYESANAAYSHLFTSQGFKVPYADFTLNDNFKYRIKTNISNRFTPFIYYNADIQSSAYDFLKDLNEIAPEYPENFMNRYINNVQDLGKLINFLQVFRPNATVNGSGEEVSIVLYFAINFDDIRDDYETLELISTNQTQPDFQNAAKLITAANNAYGAGIGMSVNFSNASNGGIELTFALPPSDIIEETSGEDTVEKVIIYDYAYPQTRGGANDVFPISANTNTILVNTSNELFLAASWGMHPVPVAGSVAERIYNDAKAVLNMIIDNNMSDMEKTLAIYDYLSLEIVYDKVLYDTYTLAMQNATTDSQRRAINEDMRTYKSFHLEGVFEEKRAVCDGISKAFVLLTAIENIKSMKIGGKADGGSGAYVNHAWNTVMLDGNWYYIDATWGRRSQAHEGKEYIGVNHYYFKATKEHLEDSHIYAGEFPPVAQQKLYFYYTYDEDWYINSENELINLLNGLTGVVFLDIYIAYDWPPNIGLNAYLNNKINHGGYILVKDRYASIIIFITQ